MVVNDSAKVTSAPGRYLFSDVALDGLVAGIIGALVVALWYLILDVMKGRPLYTPALLGTLLLQGIHAAASSPEVLVAPLPIAAYTAFHGISFLIIGMGLSWMMTMLERVPMMGFVMLLLAMFLFVGFFVLDAALHQGLMGRLGAWTIVVANSLAAVSMVGYMWKRHPRIRESLSHVWDHNR